MRTAWLATWQNEFPAWARRYPGEWDFTAESMDQLDEMVLGRFTDVAELADPANRDSVEGACWYLGEALIRHGAQSGMPSRWIYRSWLKKPDVSSDLVCFQIQGNDTTRMTTPYYAFFNAAEQHLPKSRRKLNGWRG